jgi:DNA-binding CsgD family transcriptional regulator
MEDNTASSDQLTKREQEILERLANGLSDQESADDLFLSLNTIKWYNRHYTESQVLVMEGMGTGVVSGQSGIAMLSI